MEGKLLELCRRENVLINEPMKNHTTFGCGGAAKAVVFPENRQELVALVKLLKDDMVILGNGSNVLVCDEGLEKYVVVTLKTKEIRCENNCIYADCGVSLAKLSSVAAENSLAGLEFASGIPGTVAGGIFMNAGAYGGEIKDVICEVYAVDKDGNEKIFSKEELKLSYRHSVFCENGYIITGAKFNLEKGNKEVIYATMKDLNQRRKDKQPLEYKSAGSTFKRPEGYFAGQLIEESGLKGYSVGDAQVSEKHAGFVINKGDAKASDVLAVIDHCKKTVAEKFGVNLEPEIKILSND